MVILIALLYPLIWMIAGAFKDTPEILTQTNLIPESPDIENFVSGWSGLPNVTFGTFLLNSGIVAGLAVVGNLISCSMAAYAFARLEFKGRAILFAVMLATIMLPYHVKAVPEYIMFLNVGWVNTLLPLIVPKFVAVDAFFIYLMIQFIRGLPRDLDDAARVDGAGNFHIFRFVVLPLMRPALITTAIFTFIWTYEDFFNQLIYLTSPTKYTVPLGLNLFLDSSAASAWGPLFAMGVVSILPVVIIFVIAQRYIVEGLGSGSLKG